jgi:hypothetical protein
MKIPFFQIALCSMSMFLNGCISHIAVKRVEPGKNLRGLRYYLPEPIIVGRPSPDGSIVYTIETLADVEHEYVIDAWSFMANHTAKFTRTKEMLLEKAELKQDTTAVAEQLLKSAGNVGAGIMEAEGKRRDAEQTTAKETAKAKADAATEQITAQKEELKARSDALKVIAEKRHALDRAIIERDRAKELRDIAKGENNPEKLAAAQEALDDAETQVRLAQSDFDFANKPASGFDDPLSRLDDPLARFDDAKTAQDKPTGPQAGRAAGPILLRIVEDPLTGGIRLVPLKFKLGDPRRARGDTQKRFDTVKTGVPLAAIATPAPSPSLPSKSVVLDKNEPKHFFRSKSLGEVLPEKCLLVNAATQADAKSHFIIVLGTDKTALVVTAKFVPDGGDVTPTGKYRLALKTQSKSTQVNTENFEFTVQ